MVKAQVLLKQKLLTQISSQRAILYDINQLVFINHFIHSIIQLSSKRGTNEQKREKKCKLL